MDSNVIQLILQDRRIAYIITDRNLSVVEVCGAAAILSNSQTSSLGRPLLDLVPELIGSEQILHGILAGQIPRYEIPLVNRDRPDGQVAYLTLVNLPCRDRTGQIRGILHLVEDMTPMGTLQQRMAQQRNELSLLRDRLEHQNQELAAANTELRRLDNTKSIFVSVAAHELRTPLASISGYLEILLDEERGPLTTDQRDYLAIAQSCSQRLLTITNNLLDVTRIETGHVELALQPTDLPALVEAVVREFGPQLEAKEQQAILRACPNLPRALCDTTRTAQIISNLLSNASKYSARGTLISVSLARAASEGFLQVSVEDNGMGISTEDQADLFNCFFRAKHGYFTDATGVGLGLYITRALVELHGGRIWVESTPGEGSTFHVTFPIAEEIGALDERTMDSEFLTSQSEADGLILDPPAVTAVETAA